MMAHPLALQLRNLQTLVEVAVDKNSTVVFPAPLMSTIGELGAFLARESKAAANRPAIPEATKASTNGELVPHDRHQPVDRFSAPGSSPGTPPRDYTRCRLSVAPKQHRNSLTTPDAEGNQPELVVLAFHLAQDLGGEDRARGSDRVTEGDRSAVRVTFAGSRPRSLTTASDWAANASLSSITSTSSSVRPARSSALRTAGTGPMPIVLGSTPQTA